jgi:hypothetical protein
MWTVGDKLVGEERMGKMFHFWNYPRGRQTKYIAATGMG